MPTIPDVPFVHGVPPLPWNGPPPASPTLQAQATDAAGQYPVPQAGPSPVWGIFDKNGAPVAISQYGVYSFNAMAYSTEARIPSYQVEDGAFGSYNKVQTPYGVPVRLVCGGDEQTRQNFLSAIDQAQKSLDLYSIVIPDATYLNANIIAYAFRREAAEGAYVLKVDLRIEEVRVVNAAYTTFTVAPSGAAPVGTGKVQAQPPTAQQTSVIQSGIDAAKSTWQKFTGDN